MLAINETLQGRYRIVRQLGQGGMGAIYVAEDGKRFGKLVALKEILIDLAKIPDSKQRESVRRAFEREAKILTQLEHDAFPQVIDYFLETDRQFLVMELIQGEDLGELLEKNQSPFALKDVLGWTSQLLDALDYLHTLNPPVIHRDIKPQNLKLTRRGKIKLLDFGIATGTDAQLQTTITTHTFLAATLHYSPLEQIIKVIDSNHREFLEQKFGEKLTRVVAAKTTPATDIYALGATLYHLLTGRLPVDALKRMLAIWADKPDPMPDPHGANADIPTEISDWLLKSMAIEREDRFASAIEMQKALDEIISGGKRREEDANRRKWLKEHDEARRERESMETMPLLHQEQIQNEKTRMPEADTQPSEDQEKLPQTVTPKIAGTKASFTMASVTMPSSEIETAGKDEEPVEFLIEDKKVSKKRRAWILPVAIIVLLLLGGASLAAIFIFSDSSGTNSNKSVTNVAIVAPITSPSAEPTNAPGISANEKTKPIVAPKTNKTPPQNPATPQTQRSQKPKKTPNLSDDCVYNGRC